VKKILILGAGIYQKPLIQRAKERGLYVIATSNRLDDIGIGFADEFINVDTTDKLHLLRYAEKVEIDAVTTTGTDVAVPTIGYICDTLGLPGISEKTAYLATNKIVMKRKFEKYGVPTPHFEKVKKLDQLYEYAEKNRFPFVVKTPDSSGSRGLTIVQNFTELDDAFNAAMNDTRCGSIIAEEYFEGHECSASLVIIDNKLVECFIRNKIVTGPPVKVTLCASCPSTLPADIQDEISNICANAVKSLSVKNAICEADLMVTEEGIKMIELGTRLGSTGAPEIIDLCYGVNLYDTVLDFALNTVPGIRKQQGQPAAYHIITSPESGLIKRQIVPDNLSENRNVVSISFDYSLGTPVREYKTGPDRIGHILVTGKSVVEAERFASEAVRSIRIQVGRDGTVNENRQVVFSH
jgi:biotin carboxylase